jgi:cytochrome c553
LAQGAPTPPSQARDLAIGVCGTCHGVDGNSTNPMFPRLAGQHAWYIEQQLKEFRDHTRGDPYAVAYMYGMASQLSNATIDALAQYFSHQKTGPGKPHPAAEVAAGNKIFHQGIPAQGVPACAACHGPQGLGSKMFPRLAGQHAKYIMKQLQSFQSNMRQVAIMHGVAATLHKAEMQAVADYLASLP